MPQSYPLEDWELGTQSSEKQYVQTLNVEAGALDCAFNKGSYNVRSCFGKVGQHVICILLISIFFFTEETKKLEFNHRTWKYHLIIWDVVSVCVCMCECVFCLLNLVPNLGFTVFIYMGLNCLKSSAVVVKQ